MLSVVNPMLNEQTFSGDGWTATRDLIGRALVRLAYRVLKQENFVIPLGRYSLTVPIQAQGIGRDLARRGFRELNQYYILTEILKDGDILLDIGSNIGFYPIEVAAILSGNCTIHSYEPDIRSRRYLAENCKRNDLADVINIHDEAISEKSGSATFYGLEHWNLSSLQISRDQGSHRAVEGAVEVRVIGLVDAIMRIGRAPDLIRMDIEGHEEKILSAIAKMCDKIPEYLPRAVIFEGHSWEYTDKAKFRRSLRKMFAAGYACSFIAVRGNSPCPLTPLGYKPKKVLKVLKREEVVFGPISAEDALKVIPESPEMATVCLQRPA